jgi:hypothetical protein
MTAGRKRKIETERLYGLAHHLYWELKTVQEGFWRIVVDRKKQERLMRESEDTSRLTAESIAELGKGVDRQIQAGWLPASERENRIRELREDIEFHRQFAGANSARELSQKAVPVRGESDIISELLKASAPAQIRKICADAFITPEVKDEFGEVREVRVPNWPISGSSFLPSSLSQHAADFIEAKNDPRFPKSGRPTSRLKQLWFLSRALAGAVHGLKTRTAINLIGSVRPDETAQLSKLTKRARRPKKAAKKRS